MTKPRVLIREQIAEAGIDLLRERFDVDVDTNGDLAATIGDYEAIVIRSATKLDGDLIALADRLKVIGRAGVGVDNVDVDAATRRGIVVANAPESTVVSAAEHTIGLLLALSRNIAQAHAALKEGRWERSSHGGTELAGKTLGVLGFGRIGQQVARRALALEMRVVAYDPFVARERFRELGVDRVESSDDVLAAAHFLTLHLPLTEETTGFLNEQALAKMRDGARVINAARGELVDEDALLAALQSGKVAAAALDVFSTEPYSGPLLDLPNVVVTPHLAASTEEAQDRAGVIVAEQVVAALEGEVVTNAVNIPSIGAEDLEVLGPFIPLAATLGRLAMELGAGRADRLELAYYGALSAYDTRLLTVAALNGAFQGRSDQPVNYVNAPVIAAERGVEVVEERRPSSRDFTNLIRVSLRANGDELRVAGTTIGRENRLWLVSALGFELEMEVAPLMAFFRYDDVPGVIGKVGTLFGESGVNIANMAVSRTRRGDKALMALSIDSKAPVGARREPARGRLRRGLFHLSGLSSGRGLVRAGVELLDRLREEAILALRHHLVLRLAIEHPLVLGFLVPGCDEKAHAVSPHLLVLVELCGKPFVATGVGALADEHRVFGPEALGGLRDPLVDVAKQRFGSGDAVDLGGHGVLDRTGDCARRFRTITLRL